MGKGGLGQERKWAGTVGRTQSSATKVAGDLTVLSSAAAAPNHPLHHVCPHFNSLPFQVTSTPLTICNPLSFSAVQQSYATINST